MFRLQHLVSRPNVDDEREFERRNVIRKRDRYLATNPLERYETDVAYRQKVDRIRAGLMGVDGFILDLGGNTAGEATILVQEGFRVVAGDINDAALDLSLQRALRFGLAAPHYVGLDVHELPFKSEAFSAVTVIEALHHFVEYGKALQEIYRVLKPGGKLLAFEPNARDPIRRLSEVRDRLRGSIEKSFSRGQLHELCLAAGFEKVGTVAMPSPRSSWSLEDVPAYRRPMARFHGRLSKSFPMWFGIWKVEARKPGSLLSYDDSGLDFRQLLRSPGSQDELIFNAKQKTWVERTGDRMFPDVNGIPILIAKDAKRVVADSLTTISATAVG
jgi:ubiquinone/menaquinone biosynthesis C-methylase UbiE